MTFRWRVALSLLLLSASLYLSHQRALRTGTRKLTLSVPRLSGRCFGEAQVNPLYNLTDGLHGPRRTEVQAPKSLRKGVNCYHFAGTIQPAARSPKVSYIPPYARTKYHIFWRNDLAEFGPRQEWMLKSFFATQHLPTSCLVLWSNDDLRANDILKRYLNRFHSSFVLRIVDVHSLAWGTALERSPLLLQEELWVDADLIRLLVLWNYGGAWVDIDSLLTRDLEPLLEHEFVSHLDCLDKIYPPPSGGLMAFKQYSPYLCEAFHILATGADVLGSNNPDWAARLYLTLWTALAKGGVPPFKVLPSCFSDARTCPLANRLPDPFAPDGVLENRVGMWSGGMGERGKLDGALQRIFSVHLGSTVAPHLHNLGEKAFPDGGWVERLLLEGYERRLAEADNRLRGH